MAWFDIHSHDCINYRNDSIKRKFRNLCCRELSIRISKFHNSGIFDICRRITSRSNTIITCILDRIVDRRPGVVEMDCCGINLALGDFGNIGRQDELSSLIAITEAIVNIFRIADEFLL